MNESQFWTQLGDGLKTVASVEAKKYGGKLSGMKMRWSLDGLQLSQQGRSEQISADDLRAALDAQDGGDYVSIKRFATDAVHRLAAQM